MSLTYPPAPPQVTGSTVTIDKFLKDPVSISKYVQTLADQALIADRLLTQTQTTESGSVLVEEAGDPGTTTGAEVIAPGGEYPLTDVTEGDSYTISTLKRGYDSLITDESVSRRKFSPVQEKLGAMVYQLTTDIDTLALSAVTSAISNDTAAIDVWGTPDANELRDVLLAKNELRKLRIGLNPDVCVIDGETAAMLASNPKIAELLVRDKTAPVYTGYLGNLGGLDFLVSDHLPVGAGNALVLDTKRLGGMADENLHAPGYAKASGSKIEVKTIRNEETDGYRVRARRVTVPFILEARAGWIITGVTS